MKKYLTFLFLLTAIFAVFGCCQSLPKSYKCIPEFFNLPYGFNDSIICLDEIHSQGKNDTFGFGTSNYWLKIKGNPQILGNQILKAGGIQSDSTFSITLIKDNIEGSLIIYKYKGTGHLRFSELE